MPIQTKTEDIEAFIAVIDSGGFSAAGILLDQQTAKISRSVSRLERCLNVTLLNRTTRRVELTEEGHIFLEYARDSLNRLEKGVEALKLIKHMPSGNLRVDAATPFMLHQLTPLIRDFCLSFPEMTLELTSHENNINLLEHKTDIAIRIGKLTDSNLHARRLGLSQLHIVASPRYLESTPVDSHVLDFNQHRLIGFSDLRLNNWPLKSHKKLNFSLSASSGETVRQLCLEDQGIALLSNFMVHQDIKMGRLVSIHQKELITPNDREVINAVYYRNSAVSTRISAFLDFIEPRLAL